MAKIKEVKRLICTQCEEYIYKCNLCDEYFKANDKVKCKSDGLKHICKDCMD